MILVHGTELRYPTSTTNMYKCMLKPLKNVTKDKKSSILVPWWSPHCLRLSGGGPWVALSWSWTRKRCPRLSDPSQRWAARSHRPVKMRVFFLYLRQKGCGAAQIVVCRLGGRQAEFESRLGTPGRPTTDRKQEWTLGEWMCEWMYCTKKYRK